MWPPGHEARQTRHFCQVERHITNRSIVELFALFLPLGGSTMFDQLFTTPRGLTPQQNGPLVEERRRYLAHCAALQMTLGSLRMIAVYTLITAKTLRLADRPSELITRAD